MGGPGACRRSASDLKVSNEQSPIITYMTHNTSVSAKSPHLLLWIMLFLCYYNDLVLKLETNWNFVALIALGERICNYAIKHAYHSYNTGIHILYMHCCYPILLFIDTATVLIH